MSSWYDSTAALAVAGLCSYAAVIIGIYQVISPRGSHVGRYSNSIPVGPTPPLCTTDTLQQRDILSPYSLFHPLTLPLHTNIDNPTSTLLHRTNLPTLHCQDNIPRPHVRPGLLPLPIIRRKLDLHHHIQRLLRSMGHLQLHVALFSLRWWTRSCRSENAWLCVDAILGALDVLPPSHASEWEVYSHE
jgi:hypothetical protein